MPTPDPGVGSSDTGSEGDRASPTRKAQVMRLRTGVGLGAWGAALTKR